MNNLPTLLCSVAFQPEMALVMHLVYWRLLELIDLSSKKLKSDENSEILIFNAEVVKTTIFEAKSSLLL